jgi:hypothetical protein
VHKLKNKNDQSKGKKNMDGMDNLSENQTPEVVAPIVDGTEPLLEAGIGTSTPESASDVHLSMPEDKPTEAVADFSELGRETTPEVTSTEISTNLPVVETPASNEITGQPSLTLTDKIDDHIERQQQHNVFEYVNIIAEHAKGASFESGWIENPDGTKGDPFSKLILTVDHEEIMEFIEKYGTSFKLGLPSGHELSASVNLRGDEFARNEISVELPVSGRAADDLFRGETTNPIITQAFDAAFVKEVSNQLDSPSI